MPDRLACVHTFVRVLTGLVGGEEQQREGAQMPEVKRVSNDLDFARVILSLRKWWRDDVVATVNQEGIVELRREEADLSARFLFMTIMSAGIAILGLIQSSPAVVIGAMLIAPLMGPIIGLGFAMASGDYVWLRKCAKSVAVGAVQIPGFIERVRHHEQHGRTLQGLGGAAFDHQIGAGRKGQPKAQGKRKSQCGKCLETHVKLPSSASGLDAA